MTGGDETEPDPMQPEPWRAVPNVCGSCIAWRAERPEPGEEIATGSCKLRPEIRRAPADLPKCSRYMPRGQFTFTPEQLPRSPKRRAAKTLSVVRYGAGGEKVENRPSPKAKPVRAPSPEARGSAPTPPPPAITAPPPVRRPIVRPPAPKELNLGEVTSLEVVRWAVTELVRQELGRTGRSLHPRFKGGKVAASLGDRERVEITAERFFAMVDRLKLSFERLEHAIGERSAALGDETAELRSQVARMQGSFTTFNLLFEDRADYFSSKE